MDRDRVARIAPALAFVLVGGTVSQSLPGAIQFQDVAGMAGIDFVLHNHPTPEKHMIETMTATPPAIVSIMCFSGVG